MIHSVRKRYNETFTEEKYQSYLKDLHQLYPGQLDFRVAETPVFVTREFTGKMLAACDAIIDRITSEDYRKESDRAIPSSFEVPAQDQRPHCIAFDFGVCTGDDGQLEPQLIEMQGFPTLFAWQVLLPEAHQRYFEWPENFTPYLNHFDRESYIGLLKEVILADSAPENVVLLEIYPEKQKTRVDFFATETLLGIQTVSLTDVIQDGKDLFYLRNGSKTPIHRIYNRVIFDDLLHQDASVQQKGKLFQQELNVQWVPHPNWFYRISKYSLPYIQNPHVPETHFLSAVKNIPDDLENWVIKPLFSFAGQGVIIDVSKSDIAQIKDPENWIIQKKVIYADAIETPDGPAKSEIRLFYFWPPDADRPVAANNLCRLSKGKMVGVRYNKDKTWVGGSFCLFEK